MITIQVHTFPINPVINIIEYIDNKITVIDKDRLLGPIFANKISSALEKLRHIVSDERTNETFLEQKIISMSAPRNETQ